MTIADEQNPLKTAPDGSKVRKRARLENVHIIISRVAQNNIPIESRRHVLCERPHASHADVALLEIKFQAAQSRRNVRRHRLYPSIADVAEAKIEAEAAKPHRQALRYRPRAFLTDVTIADIDTEGNTSCRNAEHDFLQIQRVNGTTR